MVNSLEDIAKQIALLARRKDARFVPRSPAMPCVWQPTTVTNPETDIPFTDISAWHFIAELAEAGHPIEEIVLDKPKGEKAYVMKVTLESSDRLYIKVQPKGGKIFGRSFHHDTGKVGGHHEKK